MGVRAAATGRLILEDVRVPARALLGEGAPDVYAECVAPRRVWPGARWPSASAQAVLDYVNPYVNERVAFGEPIANRQAVAFAVANIAIELEGMRLATSAPPAASTGAAVLPRGRARPRACARTTGWRSAPTGVQLLGGHGYVKEHPVERWYRDLRAAGVVEGAVLV